MQNPVISRSTRQISATVEIVDKLRTESTRVFRSMCGAPMNFGQNPNVSACTLNCSPKGLAESRCLTGDQPICQIPILYNLLSQLLFKRLQPTLDGSHSVDHAGFRPGHSTTDNLFSFQRLRHRAAQKLPTLWVAAVRLLKGIRHI